MKRPKVIFVKNAILALQSCYTPSCQVITSRWRSCSLVFIFEPSEEKKGITYMALLVNFMFLAYQWSNATDYAKYLAKSDFNYNYSKFIELPDGFHRFRCGASRFNNNLWRALLEIKLKWSHKNLFLMWRLIFDSDWKSDLLFLMLCTYSSDADDFVYTQLKVSICANFSGEVEIANPLVSPATWSEVGVLFGEWDGQGWT